jgi:ATP-dependent exoDNAse (exonuclease V) alpha subunit
MTQTHALDILKLGKNVFLTGAAGSGKTHVLNQYIKYLKKHKIPVAITASTGIAATHMQGKTIHSWAHIGIKESLSQADLAHMFAKKDVRTAIAEAKVLIIDEVSMLHHYRLDMVNAVLQKMHGNDKPFGGVQVVLCGDLFQLPPVSRMSRAQYVTDADVWDDMDIHICYLTEQHRQDDDALIQLLNEMRDGEVSEQSLEILHKRKQAKLNTAITPTKLFTHNVDVDVMNQEELDRLPGKARTYKMTQKGDKSVAKALKTNCLAPEELVLKKNAIVMFVQNNYAKGYVNGTLGKVVSFGLDGSPVVDTLDGKTITVPMGSWRVEEGDSVIAEINQLPLRLAWAITIHKSQGMTLDAAQIDLSKTFIMGMGYVALSRVRSLDTLNLMGINQKALMVDPLVIEIDSQLTQESERYRRAIEAMSAAELLTAHEEYIASLKYEGRLNLADI